MRQQPLSRKEIDQEIKRRQARFARAREHDLLETLREKDPARSELPPEEKAKIAEPLAGFWQVRNAPPSSGNKKGLLPNVLMLPEAAECLGLSEKSVRRLIKSGKLPAEKRPYQGRRRWIVEKWELKRYNARARVDRWVRSTVPLPKQPIGLQPLFVFAPLGQPLRGLPKVELTVSLEELWRFARKPTKKTIGELRSRIPGHPQHFAVKFSLDDGEVWEALRRIVRSVPPPTPATGEPADVLIQDAITHLRMNTISHLLQAERGWVAYLRQSVKNFYVDRIRLAKKQPLAVGDLADLPDDISK